MAVSFHPVKNDRINWYKVAAAQTIAKGDPVVLNSSGLVEVADATSAALLGTSASTLAAPAAGTAIAVYDDPKVILQGKCDAYAEAVQAIIGDYVDLIGSTGAFYVNLGASSTDVFQVVNVNTNIDPLQDGTFTLFTNAALVEFSIYKHQNNA